MQAQRLPAAYQTSSAHKQLPSRLLLPTLSGSDTKPSAAESPSKVGSRTTPNLAQQQQSSNAHPPTHLERQRHKALRSRKLQQAGMREAAGGGFQPKEHGPVFVGILLHEAGAR